MNINQILERECERIHQAGQGARNATLNKVAYTLGGYEHLGLSECDALQAVQHAGQAAGLTQSEITTSFFSGWRKGRENPCEAPTPKPREEIYYDFDQNSIVPVERIIDPDFLDAHPIFEPDATWDGRRDLIRYLETVFEPDDYVGYMVNARLQEDKNKWVPASVGPCDRTAGQLIAELKANTCIGAVLGDYEPEAGAWIRPNPVDGQGIKDANITAYRYALVEGDDGDIERQAAIYDALRLPCAALVHSAGKSLHAIVRIDAADKPEWAARVKFLYAVLEKNGLVVDRQNSNPSRLSRMPGVMRGTRRQYLVATNTGLSSWDEWKEYIEEANDNLPDFEPITNVWENMPNKSPELIGGVLRLGHKLLLAGPSKAGKSFLLLELAIAIAEGKEWLGFPVMQGKVLYVNLELDHASCLYRIRDLYQAMGIQPHNLDNLVLWQLRGKAIPLDKLAPHLIRRAKSGNYTAIIIDPLYKILTGDENSAHEMAMFCNNFDRICAEVGCSTIYCHHHSKGSQGAKRSGDRASGSGVFLRDPDALIDLIELDIDQQRQSILTERYSTHQHQVSPTVSGWRIEGTLREFPPFGQVHLLFDYPRHYIDSLDLLEGQKADGEEKKQYSSRDEKIKQAIKDICGDLEEGVDVGDVCQCSGMSEEELIRYAKQNDSRYRINFDGKMRLQKYWLPLEVFHAYDTLTKNNGVAHMTNILNFIDCSKTTRTKVVEKWIREEKSLFITTNSKPVLLTDKGKQEMTKYFDMTVNQEDDEEMF